MYFLMPKQCQGSKFKKKYHLYKWLLNSTRLYICVNNVVANINSFISSICITSNKQWGMLQWAATCHPKLPLPMGNWTRCNTLFLELARACTPTWLMIVSTVFVPSRARFTKYLTTILRLSYDNAKVTIDLQWTSNLWDILQWMEGFL